MKEISSFQQFTRDLFVIIPLNGLFVILFFLPNDIQNILRLHLCQKTFIHGFSSSYVVRPFLLVSIFIQIIGVPSSHNSIITHRNGATAFLKIKTRQKLSTKMTRLALPYLDCILISFRKRVLEFKNIGKIQNF